jgi:hypothetical protein
MCVRCDFQRARLHNDQATAEKILAQQSKKVMYELSKDLGTEPMTPAQVMRLVSRHINLMGHGLIASLAENKPGSMHEALEAIDGITHEHSDLYKEIAAKLERGEKIEEPTSGPTVVPFPGRCENPAQAV